MENAPPLPESPSSASDSASDDVASPSSEALRRLRERVNEAVQTIEQLRAENRHLRERVHTLAQRPAIGDDEAFIRLDDDPDALRNQIEHFIDLIDAYLDPSSNASE